jgi:hypothetical protein
MPGWKHSGEVAPGAVTTGGSARGEGRLWGAGPLCVRIQATAASPVAHPRMVIGTAEVVKEHCCKFSDDSGYTQ